MPKKSLNVIFLFLHIFDFTIKVQIMPLFGQMPQ